MDWEEKVIILREAINLMGQSISAIENELGSPVWKSNRHEYENPSTQHFLFLRAVRIVSGLNAILSLIEKGYTQEVSALQRTIFEFIDEIHYMQKDIYQKDWDSKQKKFIEKFFKITVETPLQLVADPNAKPPVWMKRKNVFEKLSEVVQGKRDDREKRLRMLYITHGIFSSYIHGLYPAVMELYQADEHGTKMFRLQGTLMNRHIIETCRENIADMVHESLLALALVSANFKLVDTTKEFLKKYLELIEKNASRYNEEDLEKLIEKQLERMGNQ